MKLVKFSVLWLLAIGSWLVANIGWAYNYHGAAMAPNTLSGWVVAIDTPLVFYTPDCGLSWVKLELVSALRHFDVFALNEQKIWVCSYQGFIYYSPNGGQNWYVQRMGLSKWAARIFFINDTCGWAACGSAILGKTTKGNDTIYQLELWEQINLTYPPYSADSCDIYGIHFIDESRGWFCAGRYPEYDAVTYETLYTGGQGYIAKTTDGGSNPLTWQLVKRDTIYDFFDIKFIDSLTGFVVGGNDRNNDGVVMKTQDGGQNWSIVSIPAQAKYLRALEWVGNHLWAVGRNGTIIHSANNGTTWSTQQSNVDTTLFDVDFCDTLAGLVAGNGCVLYTNNGGNTWQIANIGIEELKQILNPKSQIPNLRAYPNPFRYSTEIEYAIPVEQKVELKIYNATGRLIKTLISEKQKAGRYRISWNGKDNKARQVPRGVYYYVFKPEFNQTIARKIILY